jgi:hypothetical protein
MIGREGQGQGGGWAGKLSSLIGMVPWGPRTAVNYTSWMKACLEGEENGNQRLVCGVLVLRGNLLCLQDGMRGSSRGRF